MLHQYLLLNLESPMVAFGDVMIDSFGPIRDTPSVSAVSGLLANAIGVRREEFERLARLQDRLVFGCRVDHVHSRFTDFQTAKLDGKERGWTTSGVTQERAGGTKTYDSPHIRFRDYDCDVRMLLAVRLLGEAEVPTLDDFAHAIQWPARPLFLGRKCCLPAAPLFAGMIEAESAYGALQAFPLRRSIANPRQFETAEVKSILVTLPPDEACPDGFEIVRSTEKRDWPAGVHAGQQRRFRRIVSQELFATGRMA